ncbi:MAG: helix-hairpin-helix domain-containing protein [Solirubrobacterales bacterium]
MNDAETKTAEQPGYRPRRGGPITLIIIASILLLLAAFAIYANRQLLETDTWVETSTELLEDPEIQSAVSVSLVDALYENVDVKKEIRMALPKEVKGLAGPVSGGVRQLATDAAGELLATAPVQALWEDANRTAHEAFVKVIEGGDEELSTEGGTVTLNLGEIVKKLGERVGIDAAGQIPDDAAQIEILQSDELSAVQTGADILNTVAWVLVILSLALFGLAIYLAKTWRREALRGVGWAFIVVGALVLILRSVTGNTVVGSLASSSADEPAVDALWSIGTTALKAIGVSLITYGVIAVIGTWLAGASSWARAVRRWLAPAFADRWVAYGILALVVIVLFLIAPAEGSARLLPSLLLILLLIAGFEALRRQTLREYPDVSWDDVTARWRERFGGRDDDSAGVRISLGSATVAQLEQIKGIGPATATEIVKFRDQHGGDVSLDDLTQVSGIGPETVEQLREHLTS